MVPDALPNINCVVAVMVPVADMLKNLVLFVEETTWKMSAVWFARPSNKMVELPTFEDWTVSFEVEVAPMP